MNIELWHDLPKDVISVDQVQLDADSSIFGNNTEDASKREGTIHYDLVFDAQVPNTSKIVRLIINLEIQVDVNPGYPLIMRAIYYLARLISRQKGTVFKNDDYGKLQKVYSIWICPDPSKENQNSLVEFGFSQLKAIGNVNILKEHYDKMAAILISLNDDGMENQTSIICLLSTLLSTTEPSGSRASSFRDLSRRASLRLCR